MSLYNSRQRFFKSIVAAVLLAGVYVGFRLATSPFLDVEPQKFHTGGADNETATVVESDVELWFPNHSWVKDAKEQYFDKGRFLYCDSSELSDDRKSITLKPVAIRWKGANDEERKTLTIVADSAQLQLGSAISENAAQIGRISGGKISGRVQINGERGLKIVGHNFALSEESMRLWSGELLEFAWEGHRGTASRGVDIHLQPEDDAEGLTAVTDINRLQLHGRVNCRINSPARRKGEDDVNVKISAARGFTFDVPTQRGTFLGIQESGASKRVQPSRDQVWVEHLVKDGSRNQLVCPELVLTFRNRISKATGKPIPNKPELESIRAWGRHVQFYSPGNDLHVTGNDFQYSLDERRIDLRQTTDATSNKPRYLRVRRGKSVLTVPHLRILHTADGGVRRVEGIGRGVITAHGAETVAAKPINANAAKDVTEADSTFEASWLKSLVLQVSADEQKQVVTMDGGATVSQADRDLKLSGQKIQMKLFNETAKTASVSGVRVSQTASQVDFGSLQPEILVVSDAVTVDSPQGHGRLREKFTVRFESSKDVPFKTASSSKTASEDDGKNVSIADSVSDEGDVSFVADSLEATIDVSPKQDDRSFSFRDLWLKGDVEVVRQSIRPGESFTAVGNQLFAKNGLKNNRQIQLFGDPARVTRDSGNLEGPRIDLKELDGKAEVVGSGRIRFITTTGFNGQPLPKPAPLDIYWSDRMQFQKRSAEFHGNIRVVMSDGVTQDVQLLCSGMTVYFSKDVELGRLDADGGFEAVASDSVDKKEDDRGPIERIACHNRVTVNIEQFNAGVVNARHNAVLADLDVDLVTGDFHAIGPGTLESVSPDKDGSLQGSAPATARANASVQTSQTAFVHLKIAFIGELNGNLKRSEAKLSQNVLALVTPTRRVDKTINLQQIPRDELPERAGILRAEELTISSVEDPYSQAAHQPPMFSIVARTNARLEARSIAASADVINYDHSKEQFIIRADGGGTVTVHHRSGPDGQFNRFSGNRFEYYRRTNRLKAKEIDSLNLGE